MRRTLAIFLCASLLAAGVPSARAEGEWEITPEAEQAVDRGLEWLALNQGPGGNWECQESGVVALGALAFLSAGHSPGKGKYGETVRKALDWVLASQKPSGLINRTDQRRDMYNHGLATFVLTQAFGMTEDARVGKALDKALRLIGDVQADDGGWDYVAQRQERGHDLSLAVMQAKALRGAMDVGLDISPQVVDLAIKSVRQHYAVTGKADGRGAELGSDHPQANYPGQFTYDGRRATTAMAAAGVVCLQEFGQYTDFRIPRSTEAVVRDIQNRKKEWERPGGHKVPFDSYTLYYVGQALYQVGGKYWRDNYPILRDALVKNQSRPGKDRPHPRDYGYWEDGAHLSGQPGKLFGTACGVFILSIPNRYLPILQEADTSKGQDKRLGRGVGPAPGGAMTTH